MSRRKPAPAARPAWIVVPVVTLCAIAVSLIIALAAVHAFYAILLYSCLIALSGAIFAWLLTEYLGITRRLALHACGASMAAAIYALYWVFAWQIAAHGAGEGPSLPDYIQMRAENTTLGRRGRDGIGLDPRLVWLIWSVELAIAAGAAGWMTPKLHDSLRNP